MNINDIQAFLGDAAYEIVLTIIVLLFMKFYSKIRFLITRWRLKNKVDVKIWTTIRLKEPKTGEECEEIIRREISRVQNMPSDDMRITFNKIGYSFVASDLDSKVDVVRTVTYFENIEVRKVKNELLNFDYHTRKMISAMRVFDSIHSADITLSLDKSPNNEFAGMSIASLNLKEGNDRLEIRVDGDRISFNTDFNPGALSAVTDLITYLYTPK